MSDSQKQMRKVFAEFQTERGPARESLWAEAVGMDTARIQNIPFMTDQVAFQDLVRLDSGGKVLEILERTTRTRRVAYEAASDRQEAEHEFKAICDHLRQANIECESAVPGMFSMAVPLDVPDERLHELLEQCPVPLNRRLSE